MNIRKFTALLLVLMTFAASAAAAPSIPVYRVDDALLFFDRTTGEITGFAGEPGWLTIPQYIAGYKVNSIGPGAFADCQSLRKIVIDEGITNIGDRAFYNCRGLMEARIPASVTAIGDAAFMGCASLAGVAFNGPIALIALNAFDSTAWLNSPQGDFIVAGQTLLLKYNGSGENVIVPQGITRIAPKAFAYNSVIKSVTLPEGVTEIGDNAFLHCYSLAEINFPSTVSFVGLGAFDDTILTRQNSDDFLSVNGVLVAYNGAGAYVTVPGGITSIGSGVFMSNDNIRAVFLPQGLRTINEGAFSSASRLEAVIVPGDVEWIDAYAFAGSDLVTLYSSKGSYIEYYAALNNVEFSAPISVDVDGGGVYFDVSPIIIAGTTYVPMRAVMERLGLNVSWNDSLQEITVSSERLSIISTVGSNRISVNGEEREIPSSPVILGGRVMLPVRSFTEIFGFNVEWDNINRCVRINTGE